LKFDVNGQNVAPLMTTRILPDPSDPMFAALKANSAGSQFYSGEAAAWNTFLLASQPGAVVLTALTAEKTYLTTVVAGYLGLGYGQGPGVSTATLPLTTTPAGTQLGSATAQGYSPLVNSANILVDVVGNGSPWLAAAQNRLATCTASINAANATAGRI
jgi:hypothetical protein